MDGRRRGGASGNVRIPPIGQSGNVLAGFLLPPSVVISLIPGRKRTFPSLSGIWGEMGAWVKQGAFTEKVHNIVHTST